MPKRVQRKRVRGWKKPKGAVYVGRGSKWGNPYTIPMMQKQIDLVAATLGESELDARELAVEAFRCDLSFGPDSPWWWFGPHQQMIRINQDLSELRGKDLMCWCPLDQPCHADVLLAIANIDSGDD